MLESIELRKILTVAASISTCRRLCRSAYRSGIGSMILEAYRPCCSRPGNQRYPKRRNIAARSGWDRCRKASSLSDNSGSFLPDRNRSSVPDSFGLRRQRGAIGELQLIRPCIPWLSFVSISAFKRLTFQQNWNWYHDLEEQALLDLFHLEPIFCMVNWISIVFRSEAQLQIEI